MFKKLKKFYKNKILFFKQYFDRDIYYIDEYLKSNDINGFAIKDSFNKIIIFVINELIVNNEVIGYYVDRHRNIFLDIQKIRSTNISQLIHSQKIDCFKNPEKLFSSFQLYNVCERHNINRLFINISKYDKINFKGKLIELYNNNNNGVILLSSIGLHSRNGYSLYSKNKKAYHYNTVKYDNIPDELILRNNGRVVTIYQKYKHDNFIIKRVFEINGVHVNLLSELYKDDKETIRTKKESINDYNKRLRLTFDKQFGTWSAFHSKYFLENELEKLEYKEKYEKPNITFL